MSSSFPVLLVDDGELDDLRDLLLALGVEFAHLRGGAVPARVDPPLDLFVTTARRAALVDGWPAAADSEARPVRIAVVDEDSKTLRGSLRGRGFAFLVRRPIHPTALRLLILRALYRGDERRVEPRVPVGYEVRVRSRMRRHEALLADLSATGCRLLGDQKLPDGSKLVIRVELAGDEGEAHLLSGRVVRSEPAGRGAGAAYSVGVRFGELEADVRALMEQLGAARPLAGEPVAEVGDPAPGGLGASDAHEAQAHRAQAHRAQAHRAEAHRAQAQEADAHRAQAHEAQALGAEPRAIPVAKASPAAVRAAQRSLLLAVPDPPPAAAEEPDPVETTLPFRAPGDGPSTESDEPEPLEDSATEAYSAERRRHVRAQYEQRVVAAADTVHRVLLGRDLSVDGMRIDPHPDLSFGACVRVAVYDPAREQPLVLNAVVARDDGSDGIALLFDDLEPEDEERLEALVAHLPPVECLPDGELAALGTVVGEIV